MSYKRGIMRIIRQKVRIRFDENLSTPKDGVTVVASLSDQSINDAAEEIIEWLLEQQELQDAHV